MSLIQYQSKLDARNAPSYGNEINLVEPGFYSGWLRLDGGWPVEDAQPLPPEKGHFEGTMVTILDNLETFADK